MMTSDKMLHSTHVDLAHKESIGVGLWAVMTDAYVVQIFLDKQKAIERMKGPAPLPLTLVRLTGYKEPVE